MKKPKTLPDKIEEVGLEAILNAYGPTIARNPKKWLRGIPFTETELSAYPALSAELSASPPSVVNFSQQSRE